MYNLKAVLITILAVFGIISATDDPIIQLPKGKIRGNILKSEDGKPYYAFREIPYAASPIGRNRFQLPKEPEPWSGILNTTKNTVICYQQGGGHKELKISEDCLYINVYTTVAPGASKRLPVLVWIHGGGFARNAGTFEYVGPKYVMDHDIVVVAFNYRLGPFGFLSTFDDVIPGNLQLKDQHFALEWVNKNIEFFGGNKSQVTIAGESSGSMSISLHLPGQWQDHKVLFHGAILQSGVSLFYTRSNKAREEAFKVGRALNKTFFSENSKDLLELLQKASSADILTASGNSPAWFPVVEKEGLFSYQTYEAIEQGNVKKIPVIMGFNSEEWIKDVKLPNIKEIAATYDKDPSRLISPVFNISAVNRTIAGNLLRKIYTNTSFQDNIGAFIRWESDNKMSTGITKEAQLLSKYSDVYLYQFSYYGELGGAKKLPDVEGCEKVGHAADLSYMWASERNSDLSKFPAEDGLMLHRYIKLWTNFVKYHNPTPDKDPFLQNMVWPKVNTRHPKDIQYFNINSTLEVRTNPRYYQKVIKVLDHYVSSKDII